MEAACRLFTIVTPPSTSPAAEEPLKSDQHPEEVADSSGRFARRRSGVRIPSAPLRKCGICR